MSTPQNLDFGAEAARSTEPEAASVYEAVLRLRQMGHEVFRVSGSQSRVDGRLIANQSLPRLVHRLLGGS